MPRRKIGLNLAGRERSGQSGNAFAIRRGISAFQRAERSRWRSGSERERRHPFEYDVEASGDGRYQSEAFAEEVTQASEERRNELLTGLHLDLCPFGTQRLRKPKLPRPASNTNTASRAGAYSAMRSAFDCGSGLRHRKPPNEAGQTDRGHCLKTRH